MTRGEPAIWSRPPKPLVVATLALYLFLALLYNFATPIFEASDEFRHFLTIRYIVLRHELPRLEVPEDPLAPRQEAGQPPLYYLLGSALTFAIDSDDLAQIDFNPHARVGLPSTSPDSRNIFVHQPWEDFPYHGASLAAHLVRLLSILLGAGTVYLTYRLACAIAPGLPSAALLAAGLVAFNPQFLFVAASVDNDNLITFVSTAALLLMTRMLLNGVTTRRLWLLSVIVAAGMLAKLSGLGLPPLAAFVAGAGPVVRRRWGEVLRRWLILASVPVAGAGWWYVRNLLTYGEPTGLRAWTELVGTRALDAAGLLRELPGLFMSYWAIFGAFDIQASGWVYVLYLILCLGGAGGFVVARRRIGAALPSWKPMALVLAWLGIELAALVRWTSVTPASTGRLLFPAAASLALLLGLGLLGPLNARWRWPAAAAICGVLLALAVYLPLRYIFPAYQPPTFAGSAEELGTPTHPVGMNYGNQMRLLGYDLNPDTARPGDEIVLRLYWQVLAAMPRNYSVTVQLLTANGPAGQDDSFPGQGRIATRHLTPGQFFRDTYHVRVSPTVTPPYIARIKVGLYEADMSKVPARDSTGTELAEPVVGELAVVAPQAAKHTEPPLAILGADVALLSVRPAAMQVMSGGSLSIALRWRAERRLLQSYTVFIHLIDEAGKLVAQHDSPPRDGAFPTTWWAPGEVVDDVVTLSVPAGSRPGRYHLLAGMYEQPSLHRLPVSGGGDTVRLGDIEVLNGS